MEPERLRADTAEKDLAELRQATHGWLSAGHALKLQAAGEARKSGYAEGYAEGRAELQAARASFSEQLLRSRREVAAARAETVELVAAAAAAGTAALSKSRDFWRAEGRAEGVAAAAAERAAAAAAADGGGLREAFSAYVVSAHEQKLSAVAAEREAAGEVARDLSEELASANEMLATLLKVRLRFLRPCVSFSFVSREGCEALKSALKARFPVLVPEPMCGASEAMPPRTSGFATYPRVRVPAVSTAPQEHRKRSALLEQVQGDDIPRSQSERSRHLSRISCVLFNNTILQDAINIWYRFFDRCQPLEPSALPEAGSSLSSPFLGGPHSPSRFCSIPMYRSPQPPNVLGRGCAFSERSFRAGARIGDGDETRLGAG